MDITKQLTIGEAYSPAMKITTQEAADKYFDFLVQSCMFHNSKLSREEAESIEKQNLGYYAGYYDNKTREQVERLFKCSHPIFGSIKEKGAPTPEQAFQMGIDSVSK